MYSRNDTVENPAPDTVFAVFSGAALLQRLPEQAALRYHHVCRIYISVTQAAPRSKRRQLLKAGDGHTLRPHINKVQNQLFIRVLFLINRRPLYKGNWAEPAPIAIPDPFLPHRSGRLLQTPHGNAVWQLTDFFIIWAGFHQLKIWRAFRPQALFHMPEIRSHHRYPVSFRFQRPLQQFYPMFISVKTVDNCNIQTCVLISALFAGWILQRNIPGSSPDIDSDPAHTQDSPNTLVISPEPCSANRSIG